MYLPQSSCKAKNVKTKEKENQACGYNENVNTICAFTPQVPRKYVSVN